MMRTSLFFVAFLIGVFLASFMGGTKALATMSWAHQHEVTGNAWHSASWPVVHFLEGGQETCASQNKACYFIAFWGYWNGSGWEEFGEVSHETDVDWPTSHASRLAGQEFPVLEHGSSYTYDYHDEDSYWWTSPCYQYIVPYVHAYDFDGTYLSQAWPDSWMYFDYAC